MFPTTLRPPTVQQNAMAKFADGIYLLLCSRSVGTVSQELENIKSWSSANKSVNRPIKDQGREGTSRVPGPKQALTRFNQSTQSWVESVSTLRVLGVLTMTNHITAILSSYSSSTYSFRLLQSHGLQSRELGQHLVARATAVASILYAAPVYEPPRTLVNFWTLEYILP